MQLKIKQDNISGYESYLLSCSASYKKNSQNELLMLISIRKKLEVLKTSIFLLTIKPVLGITFFELVM